MEMLLEKRKREGAMNAIYDREGSQGRLLRKVIRILSIFLSEVDIGSFLLVHFSSGIYISMYCISRMRAYFEKSERGIAQKKLNGLSNAGEFNA